MLTSNTLPLFDRQYLWNEAINQGFNCSPNNVVVGTSRNASQLNFQLSLLVMIFKNTYNFDISSVFTLIRTRVFVKLNYLYWLEINLRTSGLKGLFTNFEYITFFSCLNKGNTFYERSISIKQLWLDIIQKNGAQSQSVSWV